MLGSIPACSCPFSCPGLRLALLIRRILTSEWDEATWPFAKHELTKALKLRALLARANEFGTSRRARARRFRGHLDTTA